MTSDTGRDTRQRRAVRAALDELDHFASAQAIHDFLHTKGDAVGLSTVYRTLQSLADSSSIDTVRGDDGEVLYRRCADDQHHHHVVCRDCGHSVEVAAPVIEQWADAVAGEHGFVDIDHTIEIFGLCGRCAR